MAQSCGAPVSSCRRLHGGIGADTHVLTLQDHRDVVLRQPLDDDWEDVQQHHQVLAALGQTQVPAPEPFASDDGEMAGRPSLLMTLLHGEPTLQVPASDEWLRSLAVTAVRIHATPVEQMGFLPTRRQRLEAGIARGPDAALTEADLVVWQLVAAGPAILDTGPAGLVHRDYWAGNTLRSGAQVTGVVDWAGACVGPPEVDAAECAFDLAISQGPPTAERFLELWGEASGRDPWAARRWWLVTVLDSLDLDEWLPAYPHLGLDIDPSSAWKHREWLRAQALEAARG